MGVVYKAEDINLGRRVALKFLPEEFAGDTAAVQRFKREARAASALNHPNVCTIHAVEEHEGHLFIVMELLEGRTLRDMIAPPGSATRPAEKASHQLNTLVEISVQIADGLEAAHQQGIIHRDIKPANIFVTIQGRVKILDFGLAKLHDFDSAESLSQAHRHPDAKSKESPPVTATRTGVTVGTAAYMSPEQVRGENLDARTDLFSLGLVIYEMATGQRAFAGDSAPALHHAILNQTPVPVRVLDPDIPAKLEIIINRATDKDRFLRYQTASELRSDLRSLQSEKRGRSRRWSASAGLLALLVSMSLWLMRKQQPLTPPDLKLRQLTANSTENRIRDGRISPDGKYLAYVDLKGIHVKTIDTDEVHTFA